MVFSLVLFTQIQGFQILGVKKNFKSEDDTLMQLTSALAAKAEPKTENMEKKRTTTLNFRKNPIF